MYRERLDFGGGSIRKEARDRVRSIDGLYVRRGRLQRKRRDRAGLPVDMDSIIEFVRKHGLFIIEDAAEQHGQTYKGRPVGSLGDIATVSFYPNKHVTTGEGGMVLTNDHALADRSQELRSLCFDKERRFIHEELGWNFRMSSLQAALGVAQLERIEAIVAKKRQIGRWYQQRLPGHALLQLPLERTEYAQNIYWVFGVVLDDRVPFDAVEARARLRAKGIGPRHFFWPMYEQPVFRNRGWFTNEHCPNAERLARRGFYLRGGVALTEDENYAAEPRSCAMSFIDTSRARIRCCSLAAGVHVMLSNSSARDSS